MLCLDDVCKGKKEEEEVMHFEAGIRGGAIRSLKSSEH
jgi:hypothetical protein